MATTSITTDPSVQRLDRRRTVANYLALTKPRIIELLLVTTVPVMFLAEGGVPSLWLVLATLVGGTLSAGAANTFNSVYDRDIDRLMHRTSNRPMVTGEITPAQRAGLRRRPHRRVDGLVRPRRQRAVRGAVGRRDRAVRRRLHDAAQAPHVAEHRLGRRRRLHAHAHRLVGGHRHRAVAGRHPLPRHLLLDAAALLAAVDGLPRRLLRRRRADAARRAGARSSSAARSSSTRG